MRWVKRLNISFLFGFYHAVEKELFPIFYNFHWFSRTAEYNSIHSSNVNAMSCTHVSVMCARRASESDIWLKRRRERKKDKRTAVDNRYVCTVTATHVFLPFQFASCFRAESAQYIARNRSRLSRLEKFQAQIHAHTRLFFIKKLDRRCAFMFGHELSFDLFLYAEELHSYYFHLPEIPYRILIGFCAIKLTYNSPANIHVAS